MTNRKPKLLIVEDDPSLLRDYQVIFAAYGDSLDIVTAKDAFETLQFLKEIETRPQAMVLDLMLPYGKKEARGLLKAESDPNEIDTGVRILEYLRRLEKDSGEKRIWVAVVTARSAWAVAERVEELLGASGRIFLKPFDTLWLEEVVIRAMGIPSHLPPDLFAQSDPSAGEDQS